MNKLCIKISHTNLMTNILFNWLFHSQSFLKCKGKKKIIQMHDLELINVSKISIISNLRAEKKMLKTTFI